VHRERKAILWRAIPWCGVREKSSVNLLVTWSFMSIKATYVRGVCKHSHWVSKYKSKCASILSLYRTL